MANLVARAALDMTAWNTRYSDSRFAEVGEHDTTHYVASTATHDYTLQGTDFTYLMFDDEVEPSSGTIHRFSIATSGHTDFVLTGANEQVSSAFAFMENGDWFGFAQDLLRGNDTITGSGHADHLFGFDGNDTLHGGAGKDVLFAGAGVDTLTGGAQGDEFDYDAATDSTGKNFDHITDFNADADEIGFEGFAVSRVDSAVNGDALSEDHFNRDMQHAIGRHALHVHGAVLFTPGNASDFAHHTFLIVDRNGMAGYQADQDFVIDVTGMTGTLGKGDFLTLD